MLNAFSEIVVEVSSLVPADALQSARNKLINPLSDEPFEGQSREPSGPYFSHLKSSIFLFFLRKPPERNSSANLNYDLVLIGSIYRVQKLDGPFTRSKNAAIGAAMCAIRTLSTDFTHSSGR